MSFAKKLREAMTLHQRREIEFPPIVQWQIRLKLAKHFRTPPERLLIDPQAVSKSKGTQRRDGL